MSDEVFSCPDCGEKRDERKQTVRDVASKDLEAVERVPA